MENEMEKLQNKFLQDAVSRRSDLQQLVLISRVCSVDFTAKTSLFLFYQRKQTEDYLKMTLNTLRIL